MFIYLDYPQITQYNFKIISYFLTFDCCNYELEYFSLNAFIILALNHTNHADKESFTFSFCDYAL